jgi:hypothetical protein
MYARALTHSKCKLINMNGQKNVSNKNVMEKFKPILYFSIL